MPANQMIQTITKTRKIKKKIKKKIQMIMSQKRSKKHQVSELSCMIYKEDELTEEDKAEIYTKWTALREAWSDSPLLLNTEEAKTVRTAKYTYTCMGKAKQ